jgi:hypothetical protein
MKPVLYRYKDTESVIKVMDGYTPGDGWSPLYGPDEVKAATAAALDRAAAEVVLLDKKHWFSKQSRFAEFLAYSIRALKDES